MIATMKNKLIANLINITNLLSHVLFIETVLNRVDLALGAALTSAYVGELLPADHQYATGDCASECSC